MTRLLLALVVAIGLSAVPLAAVSACSCVMPGTTQEIVASADLAFVGTVVDSAPVPARPDETPWMVRYAFHVERASAATDEIVEVQAIRGDGGGTCGIEFGIGQRWFVAAHLDPAGVLESNSCNGDLVVDGMAPAEFQQLVELLPNEVASATDPSPAEGGEPDWPSLVPAAVAGLAAAAIAAVMFVAFRGGGPVRPG
jgi:hypothetical protein